MAVNKIENGVVVSLAYTLTVEGTVVEDATADAPLDYLHGSNNIVPGLEAALTGKTAGDKFELTVQPADGYGEYDQANIEAFPKEDIPDADVLEPGMIVVLEDDDGDLFEASVASINADNVMLDFNDPLAGKVLNYRIEVVSLREATDEEREQGYPDGFDDDFDYEYED